VRRLISATRSLRNSSELRARRHYRLRAYRILGENVWIGGYELDLVVRRGTTLVFCEVKSKFGDGFGDPLEMVTPEKMRLDGSDHLERIAEAVAGLRLHLAEDEAATAPRDDVDLRAGEPDVRVEDPVAVQAVPPGGAPLGVVARRVTRR